MFKFKNTLGNYNTFKQHLKLYKSSYLMSYSSVLTPNYKFNIICSYYEIINQDCKDLEIVKEVIMPNTKINSDNKVINISKKPSIIEFVDIVNPNGINNRKISTDEIETEVNIKGRNTRYPTQVR